MSKMSEKREELAVIIHELDLNKVPKLVGKGVLEKFKRAYFFIKHSKTPLFLIGPAGAGKTVFALNLAKEYAKEHGVKAYYVQLSPEHTKTTLLIGKRLIKGSFISVKGVLAQAAEEGAIVVVDEATHATPELLSTMNQLLERTAMITDGDLIVYAKPTLRIIFCANPARVSTSDYFLPQAFATRVRAIWFDYPSWEEELEIVKQLLQDPEYHRLELLVPEPIIKYALSLMREIRSRESPLSARNIAALVAALNSDLHFMKENGWNGFSQDFDMDKVLSKIRSEVGLPENQSLEAFISKVYRRIHGVEPDSLLAALNDEEVKVFLQFIDVYGIREFKERVKEAFMYYLDLDESPIEAKKRREKLEVLIL